MFILWENGAAGFGKNFLHLARFYAIFLRTGSPVWMKHSCGELRSHHSDYSFLLHIFREGLLF